MKTKTEMIALLIATAIAAPLFAGGQNKPLTKSETIPSSQQSGSQLQRNMPGITQSVGVIESVNVPEMELVLWDDGGEKRSETLAENVVISDGDSVLVIEDLQPGDSVALTENPSGKVIEVAVLPRNLR